jgi:phosphoribosyl-AMP cyclohydrolase
VQTGAACHTGYESCFYRTLDGTIIGKKVFDPETVYGKK